MEDLKLGLFSAIFFGIPFFIVAWQWLTWSQERWENFIHSPFGWFNWRYRYNWHHGGSRKRSRIAGYFMLIGGLFFTLPLILTLAQPRKNCLITPSTQLEMNRCSAKLYNEQYTRLQAVNKRYSVDAKAHEEWDEKVRAFCSPAEDSGSVAPTEYYMCLTKATRERIDLVKTTKGRLR